MALKLLWALHSSSAEPEHLPCGDIWGIKDLEQKVLSMVSGTLLTLRTREQLLLYDQLVKVGNFYN